MATEQFDAVLADIRKRGLLKVPDAFDRLAAAHAAEKEAAERDARRLLELLREVTEWIQGWSPNFADDDEWQPVAHRIETMLAQRAAIATTEQVDED
jgi:Cdc6-like AAA superfamily ATPase